MDDYNISSTGLSINYLPEYIADELGYFKDVDIKLNTYVPTYWPQVLKDINKGTHHAACGGIWVPSMYKQHGVSEYRAFAKISSRCPHMLVSRVPIDNFEWKSLEGKMVLVASDGGASAFIFLSGTMKEAGVDLSKVRFIHDFIGEMLTDCFEHGDWGDFVFVTPVVANRLVKAGKGYIVSEMAKSGGPVPWSVYYSTPDVLNRKDNLNGRFALGLQRGFDWLHSHKGDDCRDIIKKKWPEMDIKQGVITVENFIKDGMWDTTIKISKYENDRYAGYQVDAGILDVPLAYGDIVDTRAFDYVNKNL